MRNPTGSESGHPTPDVRRIRAGDGPKLAAVRLRALRSDPAAFASSYESEVDRHEEDWESRARRGAAGPNDYVCVADVGSRFLGMAGAFTPEGHPGSRELYGMWVEPESRDTGIGSRLVESVCSWGRAMGAGEIRLWVVQTNTSAMAFYEKTRFRVTGETQPLPSNPEIVELRMARALG